MIDGTYDITAETPMGPKTGTAILHAEDETLTGTMSVLGMELAIENGRVQGDSFTFGGNVATFVGPVVFTCGGRVRGNTIEGIVHAAGRDFAFRGTRKGA